jgi:serine/threonine protein kinase
VTPIASKKNSAAEVSKDRFERKIQLAAKLQHPYVVSLLTAGSSDDLLYYVTWNSWFFPRVP